MRAISDLKQKLTAAIEAYEPPKFVPLVPLFTQCDDFIGLLSFWEALERDQKLEYEYAEFEAARDQHQKRADQEAQLAADEYNKQYDEGRFEFTTPE